MNKLQLQRCNWSQIQFYASFIILIVRLLRINYQMFDIATIYLCQRNKYYVGNVFAISVTCLHIFTLLVDILLKLLKKKGTIRSLVKMLVVISPINL